jgi:hypothetical protein
MRITLTVVAGGLVALGLWLIATGFMSDGSSVTTSGAQIAATPRTAAGPVVLGTALLAGGALFFVMLLRRR